MSMLNRKLRRDLWYYRGQIAAVVMVMAAGIALFVALRSMNGYLRTSLDDYYRAERFGDVFVSLRRAPLTVADEIAAVPGVPTVEPRVVADVILDVRGAEEVVTGRLVSLPDHGLPALNRLVLDRGRLPTGRREAVISAAFARAHELALGERIGAVLNGRLERLTVVGIGYSPEFVYEIRGGMEVFPDNRRFGALWMTRRELAGAFDLEGAFNDLVVRLEPGASEAAVIEAIDDHLDRYGGLGAYGRDDHLSHRFVSDEIEETRVTSILIPSIFLGITAFLLHVVLSRLVGVEREQIAVIRAFGFTTRRIVTHYIAFAAVPAAVGALLGSVTGLWFATAIAEVYARFFQFPHAVFRPDPGVFAMAIGVSAVAVVAGSSSAVRAVLRLPPAEAMRPPVPPAYRRGIIDSLGLTRHVGTGTRMVMRGLERQPWKTLLSALGIALALAMVTTGRFSYDAIDLLKETQFHRVDRSDVSVSFNEPRSPAVRFELQKLPGVTQTELYRVAPVRLRNGASVHTTAVFGLEPGAGLRRVVDQRGVAFQVPAHGLMLTTALAERLRVRPGDELEVRFLDGERNTVRVPVAATVDEMVGSVAYMQTEALRSLSRGPRQANGAFMRVDPDDRSATARILAARPGVGGVAERRAMVVSFERTIKESFVISLVTLVTFSILIAVGIVYNSGRIALSERARELASLRVLGFTRREVSGIFLGEQALLVVSSLPLGVAAAYFFCWLISKRAQSELFRLPLVVEAGSYLVGIGVVLAAAAVTAALLRRRIDRLNLVDVLKARE